MHFIERLHSRDGRSLYLTRVHLLPARLLGGAGLYLHIFHRGDEDADPHDHPWDWWTFPLRSYFEDRYDRNAFGDIKEVRGWRLHRRKAEHLHRVIEPFPDAFRRQPLITLVWHGRKRRDWGFWVPLPGREVADLVASPARAARYFMPWLDYITGRRYWTMPPPPVEPEPDFAEVDDAPPPDWQEGDEHDPGVICRGRIGRWQIEMIESADGDPVLLAELGASGPRMNTGPLDLRDVEKLELALAMVRTHFGWPDRDTPKAPTFHATAEAARAGDPDAIAALPAAAAAHLKAAADRERLLDERHSLSNAYTGDSWIDGLVRDRIAEIDRKLGSDLPPTFTWFSNEQVRERIRETAKELQARIDGAMRLVAQEEALRQQRRVLANVEETKGVAAE